MLGDIHRYVFLHFTNQHTWEYGPRPDQSPRGPPPLTLRLPLPSCCGPSSTSTCPSSSLTTSRSSTASSPTCFRASSCRRPTTPSSWRRSTRSATGRTCRTSPSSARRSSRCSRWWSSDTGEHRANGTPHSATNNALTELNEALRGQAGRHFIFFVSHRTVLKISEFLSYGYLYTVCFFQGNMIILWFTGMWRWTIRGVLSGARKK